MKKKTRDGRRQYGLTTRAGVGQNFGDYYSINMKNSANAFLTTATAISALCAASVLSADEAATRWQLSGDHPSKASIVWTPKAGDAHSDDIEFAGAKMATIVKYGVTDDLKFEITRTAIWPTLRFLPDLTRSHNVRRFHQDFAKSATANNYPIGDYEKVEKISINGILEVESSAKLPKNMGELSLKRTFFPSPDKSAFVEIYSVKNTGKRDIFVELPQESSVYTTDPTTSKYGAYKLGIEISGKSQIIKPAESMEFYAITSGIKISEPAVKLDPHRELAERAKLVEKWRGSLILSTPDPVIDAMFSFAKVRAAESVFDTKNGVLHSPGGIDYYAAIWANDQAEYINPFFPFLGDKRANESAYNSFRLFASYMNDEYKPIPSSIICEGDSFWAGVGDRGDAAMCAYGATRYLLARADEKQARELWPFVEWCLEYCNRNINENGVVKSDCDELEHRLPSGKANLNTSSLYYDALISAARLGAEIGVEKSKLDLYLQRAKTLRGNIEKYFGANVEGFDTYRYYDGNKVLRAWACTPLTVGIYDRRDATLDALFSKIWTKNGLLSASGGKSYWDRSTLYAFRGAFASGAADRAIDYLEYFSKTRLLGERVPYAIEAWPENSQRHLSAESGLYCRIFTEGLFGIRPTGFHSFDLTPNLPTKWDRASLSNINAFGENFNIIVIRDGSDKYNVRIRKGRTENFDATIKCGETLSVDLGKIFGK